MITVLQAMQLVALAPCLFVIAFLLSTAREYRMVVVPCLYFTALAASFLLPLLELWPERLHGTFHLILIFIQSLLPALSFLLILQFAGGRVPALGYWGILALPLVGGSGIVYASLLTDELCLQEWGCLPAAHAESLYATVSNGFIFLLLMAIFARTHHSRRWQHGRSRNEYWLIVALIGLNLCVMAVGLWHIRVELPMTNVLFIQTVLRMTFIYVVLTLLFRVFDHRHSATVAERKQDEEGFSEVQQQRDRDVVAGFEALMQEQYAYREMGCSRESVARQLGISENMLSRIINQHYGMRFTDVVNQYRIRDAQRLLLADAATPVTDIAFEVGFNSIPSFNRVFKDSTGFSPTAFRASRQPRRNK